ncbi:ABC transporter substrate-binding protein [Schlegelella sp. S2-27]|uniref:ABC transporter substrate-binding protein n=1 Tax=Caldimonas mangrovi TaxID=2944811 RepID=A0ABT0YQ60_9BURK|nr:ABC transporter substrate-binding protein [Caldimonas mangrovi]MCM5680875.1 ABC transporter substrate-binding protein [Caldimonas mangrovi]
MIKTPHRGSRRQLLKAAGAAAAACAAPTWVRAQSDTLLIGQTAALSGPLAFPFVEMNKGIKAAFDEVNERGGVEGRRLELRSLDDGGVPQKATENAKQLVGADNVFTFFACGGTTSVLGMMPVAMQARVPLIAPATGFDALRAFNPLVIHARASYSTEIAKIVQHLGTTGQTKCAVAYSENPFGKATLAAFEAAAKQHKNTDWKAFLLGDSPEDIPKLVDEIAAWQPNSLTSFAVGASGIPFYRSLRPRIAGAAPFSISFLGTKPLLDALGEAAKGIAVAQVVPNPDSVVLPVVKAYQAAMKRSGFPTTGHSSLEGYVSARLLIEGLRRGGRGVTRERFIGAFHSMRPYDMGGFELAYGPKDHEGSNYVELTYYNGERFRR